MAISFKQAIRDRSRVFVAPLDVVLDRATSVQPDLVLVLERNLGILQGVIRGVPDLVVEVLSPSTAAYDRGEKFAHYSRLESLQECALVSQNRMRVEHFVRAGTEWRLSYLSDPQASLRFAPIGCEITLAEIYEGVELPPIENSRWPR